VPSLALCKEDVCCGCHQYDSRSFTAGFLESRNRPAGRILSVSVFNTPDCAGKRGHVTHWTERREFNSRVFQRVKARKALLCTQLRFLVGYPIMNTITSYLFIYPICSFYCDFQVSRKRTWLPIRFLTSRKGHIIKTFARRT